VNYLKEFSRALKEKGLKESFVRSWNHLKRKTLTYGDLLFDIKYGVNTCGQRSILDLDIDDSIKSSSISYEPSPVKVIRFILEELSINHPEFTFIDFGSGKGRVLLLASEYPYKRIRGVELSRLLHKTAEENIKKWKSPLQKCFDMASLNMNAVKFELPDEQLVLFFFTPFLGSVFTEVVNNIHSSIKRNKRAVYVIYYGSNQENIDRLCDLKIGHEIYDIKNVFSTTGRFKVHLFVRK
jgi:SAM-dependent methyltransferase